MTTYTFTGAVAYDRLGSSWRTAAGLRSTSVTDPATGLLPANLTQGGLAVAWLTAGANSRYSFTCDVPGVVVDFGAGSEALYANEVPGLAIVAGAATDTAVATLVGNPASATRVSLSSAYGHKVTGEFYLHDYGTITRDGTGDNTAAVNAAHAAMYTAGGGKLKWGSGQIRCTGKITLPNDGSAGPNGSKQPPITWEGVGGHFDGQSNLGSGGTRIVLTYQGDGSTNDAKVITCGLGVFALKELVLQDTTADSSTPFCFTTLTTLKVDKTVAVLGATVGTACQQDAFILGGTISYNSGPTGTGYADPDAPFQGYGTVISGAYFNRIRRGVYGRMYCNQVVINDNFFDKGCGTNLTDGACIELDGAPNPAYPDGTNSFNVIAHNYFEWTGGYYYQIKLTQCNGTFIAGNAGEDPSPGGVAVALVGCFGRTGYPSSGNSIVSSRSGIGPTLYEDALSLDTNFLIANGGAEGDKNPGSLTLGAELIVPDVTSRAFVLQDTAGIELLHIGASLRQWFIDGPLNVIGNASGDGTTYLTLGNGTTVSDAAITLNPPTGRSCSIQFKHDSANSWLFYDAGGAGLYIRDNVNSKMHMSFWPGAGHGGSTEFDSDVRIDGNVGFYNSAPVAKPTGVAVTAAGVHAALVTLGLIAA